MKDEISVGVSEEAQEFFAGLRTPSRFEARKVALIAAASRFEKQPICSTLAEDAMYVLKTAAFYEQFLRTGDIPEA